MASRPKQWLMQGDIMFNKNLAPTPHLALVPSPASMPNAAEFREFSRYDDQELARLRDLPLENDPVQREIHRSTLRARMVEAASIVPRLQHSVRQAGWALQRPTRLVVEGEQTLVDTGLLNQVLVALLHLLRSAVDHGIESPSARLAAGKQIEGTITVGFINRGASLVVSCQDDGRGLNLGAIRARALTAGMIDPAATLSDSELTQLILRPEFSMRDEAPQRAGCSIGLDAVQRVVTNFRGTIRIQSFEGSGTRFEISVGVPLGSTQVMFTRPESPLLAISTRGIGQILPAGTGVSVLDDGGFAVDLDGELMPALRLESLLGLPVEAFRRCGAREVAIIVRENNGSALALIVPALSGACKVVVEEFNPIMPRLFGADGVTIRDDGTVAPILDLPDLLRAYRHATVMAELASNSAPGGQPAAANGECASRGFTHDSLPWPAQSSAYPARQIPTMRTVRSAV